MSKKDKVIHAKLIANPGAGKPEESAKQLEFATRCLKELGIKVDVALAKPKEEATPLARQAVKDGYKIVIAMGGDGTLEAVLRGMVGSKTRLGIIPTGTKNNMAKSLGVPESVEEACKLIASDNTRKLDVGQVRVKKGKKLYFFELTAVGLVAALYPKAKKLADGKLSNLKDAALTLIHHEPDPKVFLTLDDESKIEVKTMLVVISNAPMFGDNFLVAPDASLADGLLDISVYPGFSKTELIAYYAQVRDVGFSGNEKIQRYRARKLEIKASPKMEVMADGVMLGTGKVEIKSRKGALWIITPPEAAAPPTLSKDVSEELPAPVAPVAEKPSEFTLQKTEK
jgi:YegS/Rv2252/BmrU family lipid kinase